MDRLLSIIGNLTELSVKHGVKRQVVRCDCCLQLVAGQLCVVCMYTQAAMVFVSVFVTRLGFCLPGRKLTPTDPLLSDEPGNGSLDQTEVRQSHRLYISYSTLPCSPPVSHTPSTFLTIYTTSQSSISFSTHQYPRLVSQVTRQPIATDRAAIPIDLPVGKMPGCSITQSTSKSTHIANRCLHGTPRTTGHHPKRFVELHTGCNHMR
jgi:hypothetical protein